MGDRRDDGAERDDERGRVRRVATGPGRVVVLVYGVFALAAGARAAVQIATRFELAPVAYGLSAFSAAVYLVAAYALARNRRTLAWWACGTELVGVLLVGTLSLVWQEEFPDETVWSAFGMGYGFVPLVLPVVGLLWLRRTAGHTPPEHEPPETPPGPNPPA